MANNTQRPSVPKFGRKVPHLRSDLFVLMFYTSVLPSALITVWLWFLGLYRIYLDGDYQEPSSYMLPPPPMVEEINDCKCLIM